MGSFGIRLLKPLAFAGLLSACSQIAVTPPVSGSASAQTTQRSVTRANVRVTIRTYHRPDAEPRFVSPATKSALVVVTPANERALPGVVLACGASGCSGTISAPVGDDAFDVSLFDRARAKGKLLGRVSVAFGVALGRSNVVKVSVDGVPAAIALDLDPPKYRYLQRGTIAIGVSAKDADGYAIAGRYYYPVTIFNSDKSGSSKLSGEKIVSSSSTVKLSYDADFAGSTIGATGNGISARRSIGVNLDDDWTMFAHDRQRTGMEALPTGITTAGVAKLKTAWITSPDGGKCAGIAIARESFSDEASPVVSGGLVYYANECGGIYALNRATGAAVWSVQADLTGGDQLSGVYGTPTLDAANNLLIVPVWGTPGSKCPGASCVPAHGGYVLALNAHTGAKVWKSAPLAAGNVRSAPLVLNGFVYAGVAGGDRDTGDVQGGMMQLSESTGVQTRFFQVAPPHATDDGGSSWSPISTDGTYIYFGTGNTRNNDGNLDSVIQMKPSTLAPLDGYGTYGNDGDEDVGGGEMIYGGSLYFSGKSGKYYGFSLGGFPVPLFTPVLINRSSAPEGAGGIGTPTTDGNVISVSSGYNKYVPYQSDLDFFALGSGGNPKCKISTANSAIFSSAAWTRGAKGSGVGFLGLDNGHASGTQPEFEAFDDDCNVLWRAAQADVKGFFYAGPAVVQSGVYAVDNVGNVYAFKLPATMGVDSVGNRVRPEFVRPPLRLYVNRRKRKC